MWRGCERGSIAAIFAAALVPALAAVGVAMDYSRATQARAVMQEASDAAALAALSEKGKKPDSSLAIKMFNMRVGAEKVLTGTKPVVVVHSDDRVEVRGEGRVKTLVPFNGIPQVDVRTTSIASRASGAQTVKLDVQFEGASASDLNDIYVYTMGPTDVVPSSLQHVFSNGCGCLHKSVTIDVKPGETWGFMLRNKRQGLKSYSLKLDDLPDQFSHKAPIHLKADPMVCDGKTKNMHSWDDAFPGYIDFNDMMYSFVCSTTGSATPSAARIEK